MKIQNNTFVTIEYTLKDDEGELLDTSAPEDENDEAAPLEYVHGYGMLVPGLESRLEGLATGDKCEIVVPPAEGYGEFDEDLVLEFSRSEFPNPETMNVDDEFIAASEDGEELVLRVVEIKDDKIVCDANHPLAGATLHYAVEIVEVREATEDEIRDAAEELAAAEAQGEGHVHGPECGHEHPEEGAKGPELVQLRKNGGRMVH